MSAPTVPAVDPAMAAVISHRLTTITREMGETMLRTSRSPIFSEARDFVTAIFDADLRWVANTGYIPVIAGTTPHSQRAIAEPNSDVHTEMTVRADESTRPISSTISP